MSASTPRERAARVLIAPYVEAMVTQATVWGRVFEREEDGYGMVATDEWFPAVVTEIRRPNEYGLKEGCICVHRTDGVNRSCTYIFLPNPEHLALEDPRA